MTGLGAHSRASSHKPETNFFCKRPVGLFIGGLLYFPNSSTKKKGGGECEGRGRCTPLTRMECLETKQNKNPLEMPSALFSVALSVFRDKTLGCQL